MKKTCFAILLILITASAFAADKGEIYLSPTVGYHFFDNDHGLDDKIEGGLRYGYFFMKDHAAELEADYTKTDYDAGGDKSVTSLSLSAVRYFNYNYYYKPFVFLGVGGLFHENNMGSLVAGIGARFIVNEKISFDARVKDMLHSIGARNDIIPSVSLNIHFGGSSAYPEAYTPMPEEKLSKEPAKQVEKTVEKMDSDGDGIFDDVDQCPATTAGFPVNETGCTPDTDNDGVYDFEDRCPNSMEGVKVNSAGCFVSVTLKINFKTNSAEIDQTYLDDIQKFAVFLKANTNVNVEIQGHTDSKGAAEYNLMLSKKRAESVVKILTDKYGISKDRLSAEGYGENMPLVPNDSPENMRKNRRIDTVVK